MSYGDFGLQEHKTTRTRGTIERTFYCPWTEQVNTTGGYYLCFNNWIVSKQALEAMLEASPEVVDSYAEGEECVKCKGIHRYLYYPRQHILGICASCAADAYNYISKPKPPPPEGTQFKLF